MDSYVKIGKWESRMFGCGSVLIVLGTMAMCALFAWLQQPK